MRLIIAGVVGGIVMFFWGFLSHMVLRIDDGGVKALPNEAPVVAAMKSNITAPGFYIVPGLEKMYDATDEEQKAWEEKYKAGPRAIVIYNPTGGEVMSAKQLLFELASNIVAALFVAYILSLMVASFSKRVFAATLIGLSGWISINLSYWNWYGFPAAFVGSEAIEQSVGWLLSGIAIAFIIRSKGQVT
jgi:hypothetical protein